MRFGNMLIKLNKNWASIVIHNIMDIKRNNMWLQFGGLVKKILENAGLNLEDEEQYQNYTIIGSKT